MNLTSGHIGGALDVNDGEKHVCFDGIVIYQVLKQDKQWYRAECAALDLFAEDYEPDEALARLAMEIYAGGEVMTDYKAKANRLYRRFVALGGSYVDRPVVWIEHIQRWGIMDDEGFCFGKTLEETVTLLENAIAQLERGVKSEDLQW